MKTRIITLLLAISAILGSTTIQGKELKIYKGNTVVSSVEVSDIDSIKFESTHNGHEYVDLGLSVKWATCNVGATTPEEYRNYYAWSETTTKSSYASSNYTYSSNPTTLPLSADAARVNWGGSWRMPTRAEQEELIDTNNCTWEWITQNGVNGYKVTSKKNGNSIFLPAAGYRYNSNLYSAGSYGKYWSSSLNTSDSSKAYYLLFHSSLVDWLNLDRYYGQSVRAVCP